MAANASLGSGGPAGRATPPRGLPNPEPTSSLLSEEPYPGIGMKTSQGEGVWIRGGETSRNGERKSRRMRRERMAKTMANDQENGRQLPNKPGSDVESLGRL